MSSPPVSLRRPSASLVALAVAISLLLALLPFHPAHGHDTEGTIAFVSERTGADELYVMDPDGGRVVQVTDNPGFDRAPAWSPDGTALVFNSRRDPHADRPQIYHVEVEDPASVQRLSDSDTEDLRASWYPDGRAIVLQRGDLFDGPDLFRLDVETGETSRLTETPGRLDAAGAVSPDGEILALQSTRSLESGFFPARLYLIDLASGAATQVAAPPTDGSDDGSDDGPRWSPDGTQLVFSRSGSLRLFDLASGETKRLTDGDEFDVAPAWSPDGTRVIFQSDRQEPGGGIHVYDLATGEIEFLGEGRTPVWTERSRPDDGFVVPAEPPTLDGELEVDQQEVRPGDEVRASGPGFVGGEEVHLVLYSDPELLATVDADDEGGVRATVTIPAETDPGEHLLVAFGAERTLGAAVTVLDAEEPEDDATPSPADEDEEPASGGSGGDVDRQADPATPVQARPTYTG